MFRICPIPCGCGCYCRCLETSQPPQVLKKNLTSCCCCHSVLASSHKGCLPIDCFIGYIYSCANMEQISSFNLHVSHTHIDTHMQSPYMFLANILFCCSYVCFMCRSPLPLRTIWKHRLSIHYDRPGRETPLHQNVRTHHPFHTNTYLCIWTHTHTHRCCWHTHAGVHVL